MGYFLVFNANTTWVGRGGIGTREEWEGDGLSQANCTVHPDILSANGTAPLGQLLNALVRCRTVAAFKYLAEPAFRGSK